GCGDNHPVPRATGSADAAVSHDLGAGAQAGPDVPSTTAPKADAPIADAEPATADIGVPSTPDAADFDGPTTPPGATLITGAVQKGPFHQGSEVKLTRLDTHGDPMGAPLITYTTN